MFLLFPRTLYQGLFALVGVFQLFYLFRASQYPLPLGDDGVIYLWPVGRFMSSASVENFIVALISGFLGEDHLSPINNLLGYFSTFLSSDPGIALNIMAKISYLLCVISALAVVACLWKDRMVLIFFFLFFTFDLSMTWRNMILQSQTLSMLTPLWCLFFLDRFLQNGRRLDLLFFSTCFFLLTFSFETAFVGMPLLAVYAFFSIRNKAIPGSAKVRELAMIALLMLVFFLPYLAIHYRLYGTPLPSSRTALQVTSGLPNYLFHYAKMLAFQMSEWLFGLGEFMFSRSKMFSLIALLVVAPLAAFAGYAALKYKLLSLSQKGRWIFFGFLAQLACVLYSGRYESGMWTLVGIVLCMVLADLLSQTAKKLNASYAMILILIPSLALVNEIIRPFDKAERRYRRPYESSQTAYRAINEGVDRIIMVRLPNAEPLYHPMAFWVGNKIYNGQTGLRLYPQYKQLLFENMNVEFYNNQKNRPFTDFRSFLNTRRDGEVVLFAGGNLYTRVFTGDSGRRLIRAAVIPYARQDDYDVHLPDLSLQSVADGRIKFTLTFSGDPANIDKIRYGGKDVSYEKISDTALLFLTGDLSLDNRLVVTFHKQEGTRLNLIEAELAGDNFVRLEKDRPSRENRVALAANDYACRYWITTTDMQPKYSVTTDFGIVGTLDAGHQISFHTLRPSPLEISYIAFGTNPAQKIKGRIDLSKISSDDQPIDICRPNAAPYHHTS